MNSHFSARIVGHVSAKPRTFDFGNGMGCDLRILSTRTFYNAVGVKNNVDLYIKTVTFDASLAEFLAENFKENDFVEIEATNVRVEKPWKNAKKEWVSGSAVFTIDKIRKITRQTPEGDQDAIDAAEAELLDGVAVA